MKRIHHTFIVRIWTEPTTSVQLPQWRGMVEHAATRQRLYFTSMNDMNDFVNSRLESAPEPPDNPTKTSDMSS